MPYKRKSKKRYVVLSGSKTLTYTKTRRKSAINKVLADEYRHEHNVRVGRLRYAKSKRKRKR